MGTSRAAGAVISIDIKSGAAEQRVGISDPQDSTGHHSRVPQRTKKKRYTAEPNIRLEGTEFYSGQEVEVMGRETDDDAHEPDFEPPRVPIEHNARQRQNKTHRAIDQARPPCRAVYQVLPSEYNQAPQNHERIHQGHSTPGHRPRVLTKFCHLLV